MAPGDYHLPVSSPRRLPSLGPRGEGWVALQSVFLIAIPVAAWWASMTQVDDPAAVAVVRPVGTVALLAGLAVIVVSGAWLQRSRALSALPRPLDRSELVQTGPYRFVRHPIYGGLILAASGVALIRVSLLIAALTVGLAVVLDLKRRREEAWLLERYPEYAAYRTRTKALVPNLY